MARDGESLSKDLTPEEFGRFRDYIHQHSGIFLEEQKSDSLRISLITRATRFSFDALSEYYEMLVKDEEEFKELMNLVTINETSLFRFPQQFEALKKSVVPEIIEGKSGLNRQFRVWSAGCSTGEEPYTIAMTLLDSGLEGLGYKVEVMGTDVSTNALLRAKQGIYPARGLLSVPSSVSSRFFEPTPHGHRVTDRVRKHVTFQYHNLIKEPYPLALMGNWDVIFCRNVTIYFKLESTRRVVDNFYESLNPGGYLFIGHSETLTSISTRFEPVEVGGVFLYRKPMPRKAGMSSGSSVALEPAHRLSTARLAEESRKVAPRPKGLVRAERTPAEPVSRPSSRVSNHPEVTQLLEAARLASQSGRNDAVLEAIDAVRALEPLNAEAFLLAAYVYADQGAMDEAFAECHQALGIDPLLAAARYVLGIIHLGRGEQTEAISEFKSTVYTDSGFALAHLNLANLYRGRGAIDDACREYENTLRALYENPEGPWTWFLGGFRPDLLAKTVERSLIECRKGSR
ncbi:MAG: CheR family methyltransferase [Coriobacteriia bacterium]|nr:CheR family methyltransferase [Coriobacteriia bacterium]